MWKGRSGFILFAALSSFELFPTFLFFHRLKPPHEDKRGKILGNSYFWGITTKLQIDWYNLSILYTTKVKKINKDTNTNNNMVNIYICESRRRKEREQLRKKDENTKIVKKGKKWKSFERYFWEYTEEFKRKRKIFKLFYASFLYPLGVKVELAMNN